MNTMWSATSRAKLISCVTIDVYKRQHLGCGVLLYTDDDGRLVKVEGDPENPFNQGRLCVRCLDLPEVVYSPDRILHPLKRDRGNRGKDRWEQVGWDEVLDEIAGIILEAKEAYGPESVAFYSGTGRDIGQYITRLCWGFNSPNFVFMMSGQSCYSPRVAGCFSTSGSFWVGDYAQQFPDRYDNPQWEQPDLIVIWGNNPVVSNSDGLYGHWVVDCMKRGTKAIVIDPRLTWLASRAELFLQIRPGTDGALALGMANYLVENDLYDREFVDLWCYGFEELAERARDYPLDEVAEITEIPAAVSYTHLDVYKRQLRCCLDCYTNRLESLYSHYGFRTVDRKSAPGFDLVERLMVREPRA